MTALDPGTRRWVEAVTGEPVEGWERLLGGLSSEVHRCRLGRRSVVVRHISDRAWRQREPDLVEREAGALRLLEGSDVPAPALLAWDGPSGRLLMSHLDGVVRPDTDHLRANVGPIADLAAAVAAVALPDDHPLRPWRSWVSADPRPPAWGTQRLWRQAIEVGRSFEPPGPPGGPVLLHRDLHPLNLLWDGDRIVGLVDWVNACAGHPHAELGHCRWNLAVLADVDTADRFLARYLATTGSGPYDHRWDLVAVLSLIEEPVAPDAWHAVGRPDLTPARIVQATEAAVRATLGSLA